jgi:hypothetical protein
MDDHPLLRAAIRSLLSEMAHYAPVKAATAAQFPHLVKGHPSSLEEILSEVVSRCGALGSAPLLYRGHSTGKTKSSGVVVVTADPEGWRRGRMGLSLKMDDRYRSFMEELVSSLGFTNLVYATVGKPHSTLGAGSSIMVPDEHFTAAWNRDVVDLGVAFKESKNDDEVLKSVIEGYESGWPVTAPMGTEVIVDVDRYFVLSLETLAHTLFHRDRKGSADLMGATTYGEIAEVLSRVVK